MIRLLVLLIACLSICISGIWVVLDFAYQPPSDAIQALAPDESCMPSCWQTVAAGKMPFKDAYNHIAALPGIEAIDEEQWLWQGHTIQLVAKTRAVSIFPANASLADVVLLLGAPDFLITRLVVVARNLSDTQSVELHYVEAGIVVVCTLDRQNNRLTPAVPVDAIYYNRLLTARPLYAQDWRGFTWVNPFELPPRP